MTPIGKAGGIDGPSAFVDDVQPTLNILGVALPLRSLQCYATVLLFSLHALYMVWRAPSSPKGVSIDSKQDTSQSSVQHQALSCLHAAGGSDLLSPRVMAVLRIMALLWCLGKPSAQTEAQTWLQTLGHNASFVAC